MNHKCYFAVLLSLLLGAPVWSASNDDVNLVAPDGTTVTIHRDSYGVPHITGETEVGVFFGQGFAVAQDRLYQMEFFRRFGEGKLSEWFAYFTDLDKDTRQMSYTSSERRQLFDEMPAALRTAFEAYRDGVNTYLDSMAANPAKYKPIEFANREMERWTVYKSVAIAQFLIRNFGAAGGRELKRLQELQQRGQEWFDSNRPINDPTAPTTIPGTGQAQAKVWKYSGISVRDEIIHAIETHKRELQAQAQSLSLPLKLGSFAVLISAQKSATGNVMLLGCPQMGEPRPDTTQITHEVELDCPAYHVGGMTVAGVPLVIIGHNEHHAWSLTSGASDNMDVYIDSTFDASYSKYYHNGEWLDFEVIQDTMMTFFGQQIFTHYRTIHGPVFGADLDNHQVFSLKMTFWKQELKMAEFIHGITKARSLEEFETAAAINPMSFNLFYAGKDQRIKYWHTGKYQDRSDGVDPRLPHNGIGNEEWGGFIDFADLPSAESVAQGYFVNWNNKPVYWWDNGDNVPWRGSQRVTAMDEYVGPITGFTYDNLEEVPKQIKSHGTYQQAIEFAGDEIIDENIVPPGQSGFMSLARVRSPHARDQWPLHENWQFKDMEFGQTRVGVQSDRHLPLAFTVDQNYPNPFNPVTTIRYQLPQPARVVLAVYNVRGQLVTTLVDANEPAGEHEIQWRATGIGSGTYFYRLSAGEYSLTKKCVVLR